MEAAEAEERGCEPEWCQERPRRRELRDPRPTPDAPCPRQPSHSASLASPLSCWPGTGGTFAATRCLSTTPARLRYALSVALPLALYLTWWYAPAFSVKSWAVLLFGGISMVLAALRGYAGCEMLALSN